MNRPVTSVTPPHFSTDVYTPVAGQNDDGIGDMEITREQFDSFVDRHARLHSDSTCLVSESVDSIRGSYVMVSPDGRFFDSAKGFHNYSDPILNVGLRTAFSQVAFDDAKFRSRGGDYDPFSGTECPAESREPNSTQP